MLVIANLPHELQFLVVLLQVLTPVVVAHYEVQRHLELGEVALVLLTEVVVEELEQLGAGVALNETGVYEGVDLDGEDVVSAVDFLVVVSVEGFDDEFLPVYQDLEHLQNVFLVIKLVDFYDYGSYPKCRFLADPSSARRHTTPCGGQSESAVSSKTLGL